jgi:hypothetical protein
VPLLISPRCIRKSFSLVVALLVSRQHTKNSLDAKQQKKKRQSPWSASSKVITVCADLKDSLVKSTEYQDKFNQSYLDNYYDTMLASKAVDEKGKKTGQRTFNFDPIFFLLCRYGS